MVVVVIVILAVGLVGAAVYLVAEIKQGRADRGKEVERTCRRCGEVWYLDPKAAREKAPDRAEMGAAKMYRAGKRASLLTTRASAAEMQVHNLEARTERVRARSACPKCGSSSYTETTVEI